MFEARYPTPELKFLTSIPNTAFHLRAGWRSRGVTCTDVNRSQHTLASQQEEVWFKQRTKSHPLWGCYFSFKSTTDMSDGWERKRRRREDRSRPVCKIGLSQNMLTPGPLGYCPRGTGYQPICLSLSPFLLNSFHLWVFYCVSAQVSYNFGVLLSQVCGVYVSLFSSSSLWTMVNFLPYGLFKFSNLREVPASSPED